MDCAKWQAVHKAVYDRIGLVYHDPTRRARDNYPNNVFMESLCARKQDVILMRDLLSPLRPTTHGHEEVIELSSGYCHFVS